MPRRQHHQQCQGLASVAGVALLHQLHAKAPWRQQAGTTHQHVALPQQSAVAQKLTGLSESVAHVQLEGRHVVLCCIQRAVKGCHVL